MKVETDLEPGEMLAVLNIFSRALDGIKNSSSNLEYEGVLLKDGLDNQLTRYIATMERIYSKLNQLNKQIANNYENQKTEL